MKRDEIVIPFYFVLTMHENYWCLSGKRDKRYYSNRQRPDGWDIKEYGYKTKAAATKGKKAVIRTLERLNIPYGSIGIHKIDLIMKIEDAEKLHLIKNTPE